MKIPPTDKITRRPVYEPYKNWERHGRFTARPLEERFWEKVDKREPDECWEWLGAKAGTGPFQYGRIVTGKRRTRPAAQVSWELHHNEAFPRGFFACHHCDNTSCVNPEHIFVGTARDNLLDCYKKNRLLHRNVKKTHCLRGHEFSGDNLYVIVRANGKRQRGCRACRAQAEANRRRRNMERAA